jgi:hypothetical protein
MASRQRSQAKDPKVRAPKVNTKRTAARDAATRRRPRRRRPARIVNPDSECAECPYSGECDDERMVLAAAGAAIGKLPKTVAAWPVGHVLVVLVRRTDNGMVCDHAGVMNEEQVRIVLSAFDGQVPADSVLQATPCDERTVFVSLNLAPNDTLCSALRVHLPSHGFTSTGLLGNNTVGQA